MKCGLGHCEKEFCGTDPARFRGWSIAGMPGPVAVLPLPPRNRTFRVRSGLYRAIPVPLPQV